MVGKASGTMMLDAFTRTGTSPLMRHTRPHVRAAQRKRPSFTEGRPSLSAIMLAARPPRPIRQGELGDKLTAKRGSVGADLASGSGSGLGCLAQPRHANRS